MTIDLIATNVYNSVKAPIKRGFSFIEIWMIGVQIPILVGIFEYSFILARKKYRPVKETPVINVQNNSITQSELKKANCDWNHSSYKTIDKWTFIGSLIFIFTFNIIYWSVAMNMN